MGRASGYWEIMGTRICTFEVLFLLGVTKLMEILYRLIPFLVVRGVQLSQGLPFSMTTVNYIEKEQNFSKGKYSGERHWVGLDGLLLAFVCACFIVVVNGVGEENRG